MKDWLKITAVLTGGCLLAAGFASDARAGTINWSTTTWNQQAYGGTAGLQLWQAGINGGTTFDTSGVTVTVVNNKFGTAVPGANDSSRYTTSLPNTMFRMSNNTDFFNGTGGPTNYGTTTISFTDQRLVTGFSLWDVDDANDNGWQDFVAVVAMNGATPVSVTYTLGSSGGHQLQTRHGLNGVLSTGNVNNTSAATAANFSVGVTFGGAVTGVAVYFFQGPQGTNATGSHWIGINNFTIAPIPEPTTFALCGVGLFGALAFRIRRKRIG